MRLFGHLLRTDARQFRPWIITWVLVAVAGMVLQAAGAALDPTPYRAQTMVVAAAFITVAEALLMLALVASIVQAHPTVGSDAFWLTRPLRWDVLLAAKLALVCMVFVGVRVAGEAVYMSGYDVPPAELAVGLAQLAVRGFVLVMIVVIAAATPSVARFALGCGLALVLFAAGTFLAALWRTWDPAYAVGVRHYEAGAALASIARERVATHQAAAAIAALLAGTVLLVVQYRTRSLWRTAVALAVGASLVWMLTATPQIWPVPRAHVAAPDWTSDPAAARLQGEGGTFHFSPVRLGREDAGWHAGRALVDVAAIPPGWIATARLAGATLEFPGARLSSPGYAGDRVLPLGDRHTREGSAVATIRHVLGVNVYVPTLNEDVGSRGHTTVFLSRTLPEPEKTAGVGVYRGDFVLTLTRIAVAARLPLQVGASFQERRHGFRLERITRDERGLHIRVRTWRLRTIFDRRPAPAYYFVLRNPTRSEAAEANVRRDRTTLRVYPRFSAFQAEVPELYFTEYSGRHRFGTIHLDDAWVRDAELVIVRTLDDGMIVRTLEMRGINATSE